MFYNISFIYLSFLLFLILGCGKLKTSPSAPTKQNLKLMAVTYEGDAADEHTPGDFADSTSSHHIEKAHVRTMSQKCLLHISILEQADETKVHDHDHEFQILTKVELSTDGLVPTSLISNFKMFAPVDKKFFDRSEVDETNLTPVLLAAKISQKNRELDYNYLGLYARLKWLIQSQIIELKETIDIENFKKIIHKVVEEPHTFSLNKDNLDQVHSLDLEILHKSAGHYDHDKCINFKVTKVQEIEFAINADVKDEASHNHNH